MAAFPGWPLYFYSVSQSAVGSRRQQMVIIEREKSGCIFSGRMAEVLGLKGTLRMNPARGETSYFCLLFSAFHYVAFWFAKHGISLGRRVFSPLRAVPASL